MGVMMGRIVEVNGREVQLVLQALDEEDLIKQVDAINEMERKAKAFDNYLLSVEKDAKNEFGDNQALIKHAVELNKKIFMEDE